MNCRGSGTLLTAVAAAVCAGALLPQAAMGTPGPVGKPGWPVVLVANSTLPTVAATRVAVVIGSGEKAISGYDFRGRRIWRREGPNEGSREDGFSPRVVGRGNRVYQPFGNTYVYDARSGRLVREIGRTCGPTLIDPAGRLIISTDVGLAACSSAGAPLWSISLIDSLGHPAPAAPLIAAGPSGELFAAFTESPGSAPPRDRSIARIDASGATVWSRSLTGRPTAAAAGGRRVYVAIADAGTRQLLAYDFNGQHLWSRATVGASVLAAASGQAYALVQRAGRRSLASYTPAGRLQWHRPAAGVSLLTVDPRGRIYLAVNQRTLRVLNPNGSTRWSFTAPSAVRTPVFGADGTVYVQTRTGTVYAFYPERVRSS